MDQQDYTHKMMQILNDKKYKTLKRDPTVKIKNKIANTLKRLRNERQLDEKMCALLTPRYSSAPQMYGLPKVHKEGTPMRPIVSCIGSPSYNLAKELSRMYPHPPGRKLPPHNEELSSICEKHQDCGDGSRGPNGEL